MEISWQFCKLRKKIKNPAQHKERKRKNNRMKKCHFYLFLELLRIYTVFSFGNEV